MSVGSCVDLRHFSRIADRDLRLLYGEFSGWKYAIANDLWVYWRSAVECRATVLSTWDSLPRILDIPCLNHMLNLVFNDCVENCHELRCLVADVKKWQKFLRALGLPAPTVPEAGWFSIVELIAAIVQTRDSEMALNLHPDVVESILGTSDISEVPPEFFLLYDMLEPLYILSKNLENQRTRLCQAIPLIRTCMDRRKEVFRTNLSATFIVILGKLLSNLLARLRSNAFEEMVTSYILSIPGKREIASRLNCFSNDRCRASAVQELLLAMQQCPESFEIDRQEASCTHQYTLTTSCSRQHTLTTSFPHQYTLTTSRHQHILSTSWTYQWAGLVRQGPAETESSYLMDQSRNTTR